MMACVPSHAQTNIVQLPLIEDIPVSTGFEGRAHDVLGIRFGETRADAIAKLKDAFPGIEIIEEKVQSGVRDNRGNNVYFKYVNQVRAAHSGEPGERFVMRFTSDATGGRLYQIERRITYKRDAPASMKDLRTSIDAKYGKATTIELYPHQNHDYITYTWEKRPITHVPARDIQAEGASSWKNNPNNPCLLAATSSAYSGASGKTYQFYSPGTRKGNPGWDVCIGGIKFTIFYGNNKDTVASMTVIGTDYARSMADARLLDETLAKMIDEKAKSVVGSGAPKL